MKNSIQFRIGAMLIILTTLILCGFGVHQYQTQREKEIVRLSNIAFLATEKLVFNLTFPIWNYDYEQIEKVIETEMQEDSISAVIIRDHVENILSSKARDDQWQIMDASKDILVGNIIRSRDILKNDKKIGFVEVYVTDIFMKKDLRRAARNIVFTVILLDISLLIALIISFRILLIRPVNHLLTIADSISKGDFHQDIAIQGKDEIGMLADAFRNMRKTIGQVLNDTDIMIQAIRDGKLDVRGNPEGYAGGWRDLVTGINNITDAFIAPFNMTAVYIDQVAKGEIPARITEEARGDFDKINNNINMLIDSIDGTVRTAEAIAAGNLDIDIKERSEHDRLSHALNRMIQRLKEIMNETNCMIQAVSKEQLDIRGNTESFEGGWRELVAGINHLINNLSNAVAHSASVSREMELAQKIQTVLLPKKPEISGYDIVASCEPSEEVGGDYYDVISVGGYDWVVIGDVSGHGVTAGLIMMMVQTSIHTVLIENPETDPSQLLSVINKIIYGNITRMDEAKHMTIVVLAAGQDGKFSFSGLHEDILIRRAKTGKVEIVESDGMWIGLEPDISGYLHDDTLQMEPGDCMVLFTDGITEAWCEEGRLFGDERLIRIIEDSGERSAAEIRENIIQALEPCETPDDVTMVVMKRV